MVALAGSLIKGWLGSGMGSLADSARAVEPDPGDYGGDLNFLRRFHTSTQAPGESNHYIDLWTPGSLSVLARINGLTNNHALFVDSHGKGGCSQRGSGYGFYPNEALLERGQKTPYFSARDLAAVLGREEADQVHNIVLAGCNEERRFRSEEFRRYFVNATNITYMTPGELAFKPMFYQAIVLRSCEIKPLYGKARRTTHGLVECQLADRPAGGAKALGVFIADLYLPGAWKPYRTQRAGWELLDPLASPAARLRADREW